MGLGNLIGGGLGVFLGGPAGLSIGSSLGSTFDRGEDRQSAKKGLEYENRYYLRRENELWQRGVDRGLTPQEYYGSPAPGAGGPSGSTGATLGRNRDVDKQNMQQAAIALQQTKMQTDAQRDVARIQTDAVKRGQDFNYDIASQTLNLDRARLEIERNKAAASIGKTNKEVDLLVNQVATSKPKFVLLMKQLSMGPLNLLTELTMRHHGISLSDDSFQRMQPDQRQEILNEIIALSSKLRIEQSGFSKLGESVVEGSKETVRSLFEILQNINRGLRNAIGDVPNNSAQSRTENNLGHLPKYQNWSRDFPNY